MAVLPAPADGLEALDGERLPALDDAPGADGRAGADAWPFGRGWGRCFAMKLPRTRRESKNSRRVGPYATRTVKMGQDGAAAWSRYSGALSNDAVI